MSIYKNETIKAALEQRLEEFIQREELTPGQYSNLADAYVKLGRFEVDLEKKNSSATTVVMAFPAFPPNPASNSSNALLGPG